MTSDRPISVRRYEPGDAEAWDDLVERSWNGTFHLTRRFLAYHRDRFEDLSLVFTDDRSQIIGVLPAARWPGAPDVVGSHPGLSYGGMIHAGALCGRQMMEALQSMATEYRRLGLHTLRYKVTPAMYHRIPTADDVYAFTIMNARVYRRDLSSTIDLSTPARLTKGRRWSIKAARKSDISLCSGPEYLPPFWNVLEAVLRSRHDTQPTHSLAEIEELVSLFPGAIECHVAVHDASVVAGAVVFRTPRVLHTQYLASSDEGLRLHALDAVIAALIAEASSREYRYFDFGISTEDEGRVLNSGLLEFKASFGAGTVDHEFFEWRFGS